MTSCRLPGFTVEQNGFPFPNSWNPGTPVVEIPTPFGTIALGDASGGVCGGMVFAAADFYLAGNPCPQERSPGLFRYFCKRLIESWNLPFGVTRYFDWQRRPGASRYWLGLRVLDGLTRLTGEFEWPRIRASLDAGVPAPLGIIYADSWKLRRTAENHQVLAYGYDLMADDRSVALAVYDPNHPLESCRIEIDLQNLDENRPAIHSHETKPVRGLFLTEYRRPSALPEFDAKIDGEIG